MNLLLACLLLASPSPGITLDHQELTAPVGQTLTLQSAVTATGPGIVHLNVASLDGVYVDLEDWSHDVTQPVPAGKSEVDWDFQAVNPGHFAVYVVLVPRDGPLVVSPAADVTVTTRDTRETTAALPVVIGLPVLLSAAALGVLRRRGRGRGRAAS